MNPISLPRSPFFCDADGRYLPSLTELVIQAETMRQAAELEESLLKLRLKQRCFIALASLSPMSVVQGLKLEREEPHQSCSSIQIFPGGPVEVLKPGSPPAPPLAPPSPTTSTDGIDRVASFFDPHNPYPKGRWTI